MVFITQVYQDSWDAAQLCLGEGTEDLTLLREKGVIVFYLIISRYLHVS